MITDRSQNRMDNYQSCMQSLYRTEAIRGAALILVSMFGMVAFFIAGQFMESAAVTAHGCMALMGVVGLIGGFILLRVEKHLN